MNLRDQCQRRDVVRVRPDDQYGAFERTLPQAERTAQPSLLPAQRDTGRGLVLCNQATRHQCLQARGVVLRFEQPTQQPIRNPSPRCALQRLPESSLRPRGLLQSLKRNDSSLLPEARRPLAVTHHTSERLARLGYAIPPAEPTGRHPLDVTRKDIVRPARQDRFRFRQRRRWIAAHGVPVCRCRAPTRLRVTPCDLCPLGECPRKHRGTLDTPWRQLTPDHRRGQLTRDQIRECQSLSRAAPGPEADECDRAEALLGVALLDVREAQQRARNHLESISLDRIEQAQKPGRSSARLIAVDKFTGNGGLILRRLGPTKDSREFEFQAGPQGVISPDQSQQRA